jgi:hypothetical protein
MHELKRGMNCGVRLGLGLARAGRSSPLERREGSVSASLWALLEISARLGADLNVLR